MTPPALLTQYQLTWCATAWRQGAHNAFTDLCRFRQHYILVFRQARDHHSDDGVIRVMRSRQGQRWQTSAVLEMPAADLRDAKVLTGPDGRLWLLATANHQPSNHYQSYLWFSDDGKHWSDAKAIGETNYWLWRMGYWREQLYFVAYKCGPDRHLRLYHWQDGTTQVVCPSMYAEGYANETAWSTEGDNAICLVR